jgi:hypothetical protein
VQKFVRATDYKMYKSTILYTALDFWTSRTLTHFQTRTLICRGVHGTEHRKQKIDYTTIKRSVHDPQGLPSSLPNLYTQTDHEHPADHEQPPQAPKTRRAINKDEDCREEGGPQLNSLAYQRAPAPSRTRSAAASVAGAGWMLRSRKRRKYISKFIHSNVH